MCHKAVEWERGVEVDIWIKAKMSGWEVATSTTLEELGNSWPTITQWISNH